MGFQLKCYHSLLFNEDTLHKEHECILGLGSTNGYKATLHNIILKLIGRNLMFHKSRKNQQIYCTIV